MYQIDGSAAVTTQPTPALPGPNPGGYFSSGNPANNQPATIVTADWLNAIQGELIAILKAARIDPSKANSAQVIQALQLLFAPAAGNASTPFDVGPGTGTQALQAQQALALLSGTLDTFLGPETPFSLTNGISGDAVTIGDLNNPPMGWGTFRTGTKNIPPGLTNLQGGAYTFLAGQGAWLTQILYPVVATDGILIRSVISAGTPNVWGQFSQIGSSNQKPLSNVIASNAAPPSLEAALTAPCAGVVNAYSSLVFGSPPKTGTINVNLTLNGTSVDGDVCSSNVVHFGTAIVTAGQLCTAQINVTENSVGENYSARVLLTFTPNGNIAP